MRFTIYLFVWAITAILNALEKEKEKNLPALEFLIPPSYQIPNPLLGPFVPWINYVFLIQIR